MAHARVAELEGEKFALTAALVRVREEAETATAAMTVAEGVVGTLQVRMALPPSPHPTQRRRRRPRRP